MNTPRFFRSCRFVRSALRNGYVMGLFAAVLAGCSTDVRSHVVSGPPPADPTRAVTITTTSTTAQDVAPAAIVVGNTAYTSVPQKSPVMTTTVVTQAPPALQSDVVLAQPSSLHVWIPGYWTWRNHEYEWMAGHWELPPNAAAVWNGPRWQQYGTTYTFFEGYWD